MEKRNKKKCKTLCVTELGHNNTERIHIHGIIFSDDIERLSRLWKYGNVYVGNYVNEQTVNYIIKYVNKLDKDHHERIYCNIERNDSGCYQ